MKRKKSRLDISLVLWVVLTVGAAAVPCAGDVITVNWDGTGGYLTIQAAIDAAVNGDTVIVEPGTYTGAGNKNLDFDGKAITVRSTEPNNADVVAATVIDCQNSGRGFYFHSGEGNDSIVAGLTITNGYLVSTYGGGIYCRGGTYSASPTIRYCRIIGNRAQRGGGIYNLGSPKVYDCVIADNWASQYGGGVYNDGNPTFDHCVIADNSADVGGGGVDAYYGNAKFSNCIIWGNTYRGWSSSFFHSYATVSYSNVQDGWPGPGNINTDPCFVDSAGRDYHLRCDSPCIDAGDPCYVPAPGETDIDGDPRVMLEWVDMGVDEFFHRTPCINVWPSEFFFDANQPGPNPQPQLMSIHNDGIGTLSWEIIEDRPWLHVDPNMGSSTGEPNEVAVSVDISGLACGVYDCNLTVSDPCACNDPQTVQVTLVVYGPEIELSSDQLAFAGFEGGANPDDQTITIRNTGVATLNWAITDDCNWLEVDPNSSSCNSGEANDVTLGVDIPSLVVGTYNCTLMVSDPCACNDPQTVEVSLQVFAEGATDFGDCPAWYPTLLSDDGARHRIDPNLFLGSLIDEEADGQPSDDANGDDANYLPDEDGVFFLSSIVAGGRADVEIVASANGLLDAWLDFNIDGDWSDPCEQIFAGFALEGGPNLLSFGVPRDASFGQTYARFRLSTAGGLDPNGPAADGEVEDYLVLMIEPCLAIDDPQYDQWVLQGRPRAWCCPYHSWGDANGDCCIAINDILIMRPPTFNTAYGSTYYNCLADLNHDGFVNINDVMIIRPPNFNIVFPGPCREDWRSDCGPNP